MDHWDHSLIRGGDVIDGTGAAAVRADVRLRDGRIVEIGPDQGDAVTHLLARDGLQARIARDFANRPRAVLLTWATTK